MWRRGTALPRDSIVRWARPTRWCSSGTARSSTPMMRVVVLRDSEAGACHVARSIAGWLEGHWPARGRAHLALEAGTTPAAVHAHLATMLDDWSGVELWLGDERMSDPRRPRAKAWSATSILSGRRSSRGSYVRGCGHAVPEPSPERAAAQYTDDGVTVARRSPGRVLSWVGRRWAHRVALAEHFGVAGRGGLRRCFGAHRSHLRGA